MNILKPQSLRDLFVIRAVSFSLFIQGQQINATSLWNVVLNDAQIGQGICLYKGIIQTPVSADQYVSAIIQIQCLKMAKKRLLNIPEGCCRTLLIR